MSAMGAIVATIGVGVVGDCGWYLLGAADRGRSSSLIHHCFAENAPRCHFDDRLLAKVRIDRLGFSEIQSMWTS